MISENGLREALGRAADGVRPAADAEQRLRSVALAPRRWRSAVVVVLAAAVIAGIALAGGVVAHRGSDPVPSTVLPGPGPLPSGRYTVTEGFPDAVRFSVADGWRLRADAPGDLRLRPPGASQGAVGLVRLEGVFDATGLVPTPRDLTTWLKTRPDLTVVESGGERVGSLVGTRLTLRASEAPSTTGPCRGDCVAVGQGRAGALTVPAGAEVVVVSVNDHGSFFLAYGIAPASQQPATTRALDALLASLRVPA